MFVEDHWHVEARLKRCKKSEKWWHAAPCGLERLISSHQICVTAIWHKWVNWYTCLYCIYTENCMLWYYKTWYFLDDYFLDNLDFFLFKFAIRLRTQPFQTESCWVLLERCPAALIPWSPGVGCYFDHKHTTPNGLLSRSVMAVKNRRSKWQKHLEVKTQNQNSYYLLFLVSQTFFSTKLPALDPALLILKADPWKKSSKNHIHQAMKKI